MKKLLLLLFFIVLLAAGCKKDGSSSQNDGLFSQKGELLVSTLTTTNIATSTVEKEVFKYDDNNRLISKTLNDNSPFNQLLYSYFPDGNVKQTITIQKNGDTTYTTYAYLNGMPVSSSFSSGFGTPDVTKYIVQNNRVTSIISANGDEYKYSYDGNNIKSAIEVDSSDEVFYSTITTFGTHKNPFYYSGFKYLLQQTGAVKQDNEILEFKETFPITIDEKYRYTYNSGGYPVNVIISSMGKDSITETYTYIQAK